MFESAQRIGLNRNGSHPSSEYNNISYSESQYPTGSLGSMNRELLSEDSANISVATVNIKEKLPFNGSRRPIVNNFPKVRGGPMASSTRNSTTSTRSNYKHQPKTRLDSTASMIFRKFSNSISRSFSDITEVKPDDRPLDDVFVEFFGFLKALLKLCWVLGTIGFRWILFLLTWILEKVRTLAHEIPRPNWKIIKEMSSDRNKVEANQNNDLPKINEESIIMESTSDNIPLLPAAKISKYPNYARRLEELTRSKKEEPLKETVEANKEQQAEAAVKSHYGTQFYRDESASATGKLESKILDIANNIASRPKRMESKSYTQKMRDTMVALKKLDPVSSSNPKPTFTRSTARFKDCEWLKDENEDYINNLEYTRLYKEYQNIIEERTKMEEMSKIKDFRREGVAIKPLSLAKMQEVEETWDSGIRGVLNSKFSIDIALNDLRTLSDGKWLNDQVINFYGALIAEKINGPDCKGEDKKIHVFSTFFYSNLKDKGYKGVARWAKRAKIDVSKLDYLFVPVNLNQMHWTLAYVDNVNHRFVYVDSLYGCGDDILMKLMDYMTQETERIYGKDLNGMDYTLYDMESEAQGPKQKNGYDCGVFTCTAMYCLASNKGFCYSQGDMSFLRRKIAYEILKGRLEK